MIMIKYLTILSIAVVFTLAAESTWSEADIQTAKDEAAQMNTSFKSNYANASALEANVANPMTTETELSTMDGSQRGSANVMCSGHNKPFAKLKYTTDSNVDITLFLSLDTNGDGNLNLHRSYSNISGIHAYGVFSCSSATFDNCRYYEFQFQNSDVVLTQISPESAGGAYCTNIACQSIAANAYRDIIESIGSSLSAQLQTVSSRYILTNSTFNNDELLLYGQDLSNCGEAGYDITSGIPSSSQLSQQGEVARSSSGSDSTYGTIMQIDNNEMNLNPISEQDKADITAISARSTQSATVGSDGKTLEYTNTYKDENGNWVTSNDSSFINAETPPESQSCMAEWEEAVSTMTTDEIARGNTGTAAGGPSVQVHSEIRECTGQNYTDCPHTAPERVRYPCGSLDASLGEAASGLQIANELSKDFICSQ